MSSYNLNGGFGSIPDAESHGAYCFCYIGFLFIKGRLKILDKVQTGKWLAERQIFYEGFNGRPEKLLDFSYFWCVWEIFLWLEGKTFLIKIY